MKISKKEQDGVIVFVLEGRIDSEGVSQLEEAMNAIAGQSKVVMDMADVRYINSAGLRILADVLTRNREAGGDLRLAGVNKKVQRVFKIIGFDKFFQFHEDVDAAVSAFS